MNTKIKILYLTTSPVMGGAEKQLYYLATQLDPERFLVKVCVLKSEDDGVLVHMLKEKGVHTESIGMKSKCGFDQVFIIIFCRVFYFLTTSSGEYSGNLQA